MPAAAKRLRRALIDAGLRFDLSPAALQSALRKSLGARAFAEFEAERDAYETGWVPAAEIYRRLPDAEAAALFQSGQAKMVLDAGARLFDSAVARAPRGAKVVELGAWHGAFAAAVAALRPDLRCVALDRAANLVRAGKAVFSRPNLVVARYDYAAPSPPKAAQDADVVLGLCPVDFLFGEPDHPLRGLDCRGSAVHAETVREASPFFAAARAVLRPGGVCSAVFRAPNRARGLAVVDAAAAAGFAFAPRRAARFKVGGAPLLVATWRLGPAPAPGPSEAAFRRFWARDLAARPAPRALYRGDEALDVHAALPRRRVVAETFVEAAPGVVAREERGFARGCEYRLRQAEDGCHELRVRPVAARRRSP
jgi:hypothetical protein